MIPLARTTARVLLDTSPFISFAQGGALFQLAGYLGDRAAIPLDVAEELRRNSTGRFPEIKTLALLGWPPGEPLALPPRSAGDAAGLRRPARRAPRPRRRDHGRRPRKAPVPYAPRIAPLHRPGSSLRWWAAEALDDSTGFAVFDAATWAGVGREQFNAAVRPAREAD